MADTAHLPSGEPLIDVEDASPSPVRRTALGGLVLGVSLVLIAYNLRTVFSSLSTLLPEAMRATGLSPAGASALTTLPVLCLGLFSFPAAGLARRFGAERVILACLAALTLGTALRAAGLVPALAFAAVLAGGAIAMVNVLLPGLVKRDFPARSAMMTGLYTMALCAGAASAAGLTVPLERMLGGDWALALGAWAAPALLVTLLWLPQAVAARPAPGPAAAVPMRALLREPVAWQVTLLMGLQSAMAYMVFGWLAPILRERGLDPVLAGLVVSMSVVVQMLACLATPSLMVRRPSQGGVVVALLAFATAGFLGCVFAPLGGVWAWAAIQGLGQGGLIAAGMTLIILRSPAAHVAARLSGMAQGFGYSIAALGPLVAGMLRGATGDFRATGVFFAAVAVVAAWNGYGAGRPVLVGAGQAPRRERSRGDRATA